MISVECIYLNRMRGFACAWSSSLSMTVVFRPRVVFAKHNLIALGCVDALMRFSSDPNMICYIGVLTFAQFRAVLLATRSRPHRFVHVWQLSSIDFRTVAKTTLSNNMSFGLRALDSYLAQIVRSLGSVRSFSCQDHPKAMHNPICKSFGIARLRSQLLRPRPPQSNAQPY